jgi:hypothetical protein
MPQGDVVNRVFLVGGKIRQKTAPMTLRRKCSSADHSRAANCFYLSTICAAIPAKASGDFQVLSHEPD